jgi:hypothetical protein
MLTPKNYTDIDNAILRKLERMELTMQRILVKYKRATKKDFDLTPEKELGSEPIDAVGSI